MQSFKYYALFILKNLLASLGIFVIFFIMIVYLYSNYIDNWWAKTDCARSQAFTVSAYSNDTLEVAFWTEHTTERRAYMFPKNRSSDWYNSQDANLPFGIERIARAAEIVNNLNVARDIYRQVENKKTGERKLAYSTNRARVAYKQGNSEEAFDLYMSIIKMWLSKNSERKTENNSLNAFSEIFVLRPYSLCNSTLSPFADYQEFFTFIETQISERSLNQFQEELDFCRKVFEEYDPELQLTGKYYLEEMSRRKALGELRVDRLNFYDEFLRHF